MKRVKIYGKETLCDSRNNRRPATATSSKVKTASQLHLNSVLLQLTQETQWEGILEKHHLQYMVRSINVLGKM